MIGKTISHYRIIEELGRGGMGVVYLAEDTKLDRKVALKFLPPELGRDKDAKERFVNEAKAAAALNHVNICTVHEIDEHEDRMFMAMEFVDGSSLKEAVARAPETLERSVDIAAQIAQGLVEAHEKGIVHRDIKPANIMVTSKGGVKIMDFGLAKLRNQVGLTKEGTALGTVSYMSPEQARGGEVDRRTDIWSLGALLYELITGRVPFKGEYEQATIYSILNDEPKPPTSLRTGVPMELERIVAKALAKNPDERYQHIDEMLVDLRQVARRLGQRQEQIQTRSTAAEPVSAGVRPATGKRKMSWLLVAAIVVIAAIALFIVGKRYPFDGGGKVIDSIAVLPLDNLSGDPEQEYFADGMTEALITELSRIEALKVISRTSVMRFKDSDKSLKEIARELDVAAVVEGSAMLVGGRIRITAQLIEAATDHHIWADDYERDFEDVIALQKEVARAIAREVQVAVTPEEEATLERVHQVDPEAHALYLKGLHYVKQWGTEEQNRAIELFEQAIDRDSSFALAYVGMAEAYNNLFGYSQNMGKEYLIESKEWAEKALEIDETLGLAYAMLADFRFLVDWDFEGAEEYFKLAIELTPGNATAHSWYANFLFCMGRREEAIAEARRSRQLDPMDVRLSINEAFFLGHFGEYDLAEKIIMEVFEEGVEEARLHYLLGLIYVETGRNEAGLEELAKAEELMGEDVTYYERAYYYAKMGREEEARVMLDEILAMPDRGDRLIRIIITTSTVLGDYDLALDWLEWAFNERYNYTIFLIGIKDLDPLRSDPRFQDILRRMGIEN
jgi:serine/threonine protein kinase/TolB-like protein/Tfp pilus assembly protein PilF